MFYAERNRLGDELLGQFATEEARDEWCELMEEEGEEWLPVEADEAEDSYHLSDFRDKSRVRRVYMAARGRTWSVRAIEPRW